MKLFEVTRWGNEHGGPNEADTNYLVCARHHVEAAALVRELSRELDAITELGECTAQVDEPLILRGPYIEHKLDRGTWFTLWSWNDGGLGVWVPNARARDGLARCSYVDGRLAAEQAWKAGRENGISMRFHADGAPMQVGSFERGRPTGLHEWWHPNGKKASRHEYDDARLAYARWDPRGVLIEEGEEPRRPIR